MTEQEIEKLREKLGSDYSVKRLNGAITVELVDIWDGVEFLQVNGVSSSYYHGQILKITGPSFIRSSYKYLRVHENAVISDYCTPSTEAAYVEQLKAKAKELYGEIKDGDRFDSPTGNQYQIPNKFGFQYHKHLDELRFSGVCLYLKGKWAKKVERIKVDGDWIHFDDTYLSIRFSFPKKALTEPSTVAIHLAKCLEDYLNKS